MRKAFNFYRSYYDIALQLPESDRLSYLMAICQWQFTGEEPTDIEGMAKFALLSQQHSIIKQVEGYKSGTKGGRPLDVPPKGTPKGKETIPHKGTHNQVQEKGQVQEKVKEKGQCARAFAHLQISFSDIETLKSEGYTEKEINSTLDAIENYAQNKRYKSLFLTARKWLEQEKQQPKRTEPVPLIQTMPKDPEALKKWQAENRARILGQYDASMNSLEKDVTDEADD